ncbi:MAG: hypothetical protein K6G88_05510 [Lachnospiraceae bacterium]|nr:hypothetical protein [Lachnospiraceae bacterium]
MRWYNYLYVGEKAKKTSEDIIEKINAGKMQVNKFALALPFNDSDILDIIPTIVLMQKRYLDSDLVIVGIADGKSEAMDLMQDIIMECYNNTKGFDLKSYIFEGGVSS